MIKSINQASVIVEAERLKQELSNFGLVLATDYMTNELKRCWVVSRHDSPYENYYILVSDRLEEVRAFLDGIKFKNTEDRINKVKEQYA